MPLATAGNARRQRAARLVGCRSRKMRLLTHSAASDNSSPLASQDGRRVGFNRFDGLDNGGAKIVGGQVGGRLQANRDLLRHGVAKEMPRGANRDLTNLDQAI